MLKHILERPQRDITISVIAPIKCPSVGHNQRQSLADIQNQREYPTAEEFEFWEHLAN